MAKKKSNNKNKGAGKGAAKAASGSRSTANAAASRRAAAKMNPVLGSSETSIDITQYLAYLPGILMVLMIWLIFILDIVSPVMKDTQYQDFHYIFRVFDYVGIVSGVSFLIYAGVKHKLSFSVRDYLFGGFMLTILISTVVNGLNHDAAFGIPYRYIGIFNMFAFFIVYMKVSGYIERVSFRHTIMTGYMIIADLIALSAIYETYYGDIAAYQNKVGLSTVFVNSNHYGYFIAMAVLIGAGYFMYESGWKFWVGSVTAVLNAVVLALNNTLGAILATGLCIVVMIILVLLKDAEHRKKAVGLGAVIVLGAIGGMMMPAVRDSVVVLISDVSAILNGTATGHEGSGRLNLWLTTISYIKEKPLFGFGCEGITYRLLEATGLGDAHCEPLTFAAYYGIPGMLLYLAGVIAAAVSYFRNRAELPSYCRIAFIAAAGYFISSLFGVPMFNTAPFFYIFMGLAAEDFRSKEKAK